MTSPVSRTVTIVNKLGLHARPAMMLVDIANRFDADVTIRRCDQSDAVDGKSIMQMMMLAATQGTQIEITAHGSDAESAIKELAASIESKFNED